MCQALAAEGTTHSDRKDFGIMVQRGFQDLDGHLLELVFMEPDATA